MKKETDSLVGAPCRIKINGLEIDFARCVPIAAGHMIALEDRTGIKLMSSGSETLTSVKRIIQFVHFFANVIDERVREEDVAVLPFDVVAWIARWINANGVRDITDQNFIKPHTY